MANTLSPGDARIGWLWSQDPGTPKHQMLLQHSGSEITGTILWDHGPDLPAFRSWFFGEPSQGLTLPNILWFEDNQGPLTLLDCHMRRGSISRYNKGFFTIGRVVSGGSPGADYRRLNGMRSALPYLNRWLDGRSLSYDITPDDAHKIQSLDLHLRAPDPIPIARKLNLKIRPGFTFDMAAHGDTSTITETLFVETLVVTSRDWEQHEQAHNRIRDLLMIAAWHYLPFSDRRVLRTDDPHTTLSGRPVNPKWAPVLTTDEESTEWKSQKFLFRFDQVGSKGIRTWTRIHDRHTLGILQILDTLWPGRMAVETMVAQVAMGMDAIGYGLHIEDGVSPAAANARSHERNLRRILRDIAVKLPFDRKRWLKEEGRAYKGVKHANNPLPDFPDLVSVYRRSILVFRIWAATRVGVRATDLEESLKSDPMARDLQES